MNKISCILFMLFCSKLSFSQTIDSVIVAKDTLIVVKDTLIIPKRKVATFDTLSYSSEYKRDKWRMVAGVRAGLSKGKFDIREGFIDKISNSGLPIIDENGKIEKSNFVNNTTFGNGFCVGVFARFLRGSFFLQPEFIFSSKAGIIDILKPNGSLEKRINAGINSIEVPILLGIRSRKTRVFFGPSINYGININKELKTTLNKYTTSENLGSDFFNRPIMNFNVGLGFEINSFFIDLRFEKGLRTFTNIDLGPSNSTKPFRLFADGIHLSVGYITK